MLAVTFDIGTTAVKCAAVKDDGTVVFTDSAEVRTIENGNDREQVPEEWYEAFRSISRRIFETIPPEQVQAVVFSGQMQDVIPVDSDGNAVRNAILYSDGRAGEQAEKILRAAGGERIAAITGNHFDGSMPLAKILWLKEHEPEHYERTASFLISSKDYVVAKLTGNFIGDVTACSTAGAMDLRGKQWSQELATAAGIDKRKFPELKFSHELAGTVTPEASAKTGYSPGTRVYTGTGDAGATTLASGILKAGEYNINLGTSSWVAAVSNSCMESQGGGFNLAAMQAGSYINVVPFLNGGNVHKFLAKVFSREGGETDYLYVSELLAGSEPGSRGVFFLPYLTGERFPVMDGDARGCWLGIGQETTARDLARSALEGAAYSIRQGLELFPDPPEKITLVGGGAREEAWCRILSSVMGREIYVYRDPDLLPALATASAAFLAEGRIAGYGEFIQNMEKREACIVCRPEPGTKELYDRLYEKYKTIYPMIREFY